MTDTGPSNSLGLEFSDSNVLNNSSEPSNPPQSTEPNPPSTNQTPSKEKEGDKRKPYVNPDRVKTGGVPRDKLSKEQLEERMARIREQNEKIKQRRMDVLADEDAFRKKQEAEHQRAVQTRKVQEGVDRTREKNAQRKLDHIQSREWDSEKHTAKPGGSISNHTNSTSASTAPIDETIASSRGNGRGRGRTRGRGRGRGRGGNLGGSNSETLAIMANVGEPPRGDTMESADTRS